MKMPGLTLKLIVLFALTSGEAWSQLIGALSGTLGPGTYTVNGHISVSAGDSLRLQPGTTFNFAGVYRFEISGTLLAEGTITDSIRFTSDTTVVPSRWRKIRFLNATSSGSRLRYCVIEHARGTDVFPQVNGGGVYISASNPVFEHCAIRRNICDLAGGAVYCTGASPTFSNCRFESNVATGNGGAVSLTSSSLAMFDRCEFRGNSGVLGGAGIIQTNSNATFSYCRFVGNVASSQAGALYIFGASPSFYDCHFRYNVASTLAGAVYIQQSTTRLEHCSIAYTTAGAGGAAVYMRDASPSLVSTMLVHSNDRGIFFYNCPTSVVEYCNFYNHTAGNFGFRNNLPSNGPAGVGVKTQRNPNRDSCDVYSNIQLNPQFADTVNGQYLLTTCTSPCIGAGKPLPTLQADILGNPRPYSAAIQADIGGFENEYDHKALRGVITGTYGPGLFLVCDSINVVSGDSARLLPGTTLDFNGPYHVGLTGRLLAQGTATDSIVFTTDTLSNPSKWRGMRFTNQNSSGSRFSYCVIENARATGSGALQRGGAIYCSSNSNPQFTHSTIRRCRADQFGGAVYVSSSSPTFSSCVIERCHSAEEGGAFYLTNASPQVSYSVLSGNSAANTGGAAWISAGTPVFTRCTFVGNSAPSQGGGVYMISTTANFNSNIFSHSTGIGVFFRSSGSSVFRYNNVSNNSGGNMVLYSQNPVPPHGPVGVGVKTQMNANGDSCDVYYNVQLDPLYVSRLQGDFNLTEASPSVDAGDPALAQDADNTVADIGRYFFDQTPPPPPARLDSAAIVNTAGTCTATFTVGDSFCVVVYTDSNAQDVLLDFSCIYGIGAIAPESDSLWLTSYTPTITTSARSWTGCLVIEEGLHDEVDSTRNLYRIAPYESDCQTANGPYIINVRAFNSLGQATEPDHSFACGELRIEAAPPPVVPAAVIHSAAITNTAGECDSLFREGDDMCVRVETDTNAHTVLLDWSCVFELTALVPESDSLLLSEYETNGDRRIWQGCVSLPGGIYSIADSARNSYIIGPPETDCQSAEGSYVIGVQAFNIEAVASVPDGEFECSEANILPADTAREVVIIFDADSIRLYWSSEATLFHIYGAVAPESTAVLLGTVTETQWTDPESATRPEKFFYHVTAEKP